MEWRVELKGLTVDRYKSVSGVEVSEVKVRWSGCWGLGDTRVGRT